MKKFLAIVLLCLPVFGQAVYSGPGYSSGAAMSSVASSGTPLTYAARTDHCITGSEPDCVVGRTTGQAGSALSFLGWDTDPLPFQELSSGAAGMNSCFTDPDFGTYECFVTDQSFQTATTVFSLGDSGGNRFSSDETLMTLTNTGSADLLIDIVPSRFKAHTCAPSPSSAVCFVESQIKSGTLNGNTAHDSTLFNTQASVAMSSKEPMTLYERGPTKLYRLVVTQPKDANGTPTGLDTLTRTLVADFTSDTPVPCKVLPPDYKQTWNSAGAFTAASGGGGSYQTRDWNTGGTGLVNADTFILPVNNNPGGANGNWMYQASGSGAAPWATSGTEPNWAASCPTKGSTCTDGAVTWTNVGNISGQGPGFDVYGYDPDGNPAHGCFRLNTYMGKIFRGTGSTDPGCPAMSATSCGSGGDMLTDDWLTCDRQANVSAPGTGSRPCQMRDRFGLHAGGNSGDHYVTLGPTSAGGNSGLFPSAVFSCVSSGLKLNPPTGSGKWTAGTSYTFHDFVFGSDGRWYDKKSSGTSTSTGDPTTDSTNWEDGSAVCYGYIWDRYTTMARPLIGVTPPIGVTGGGFSTDGHNIGGNVATYRGGKMFKHVYSKPTCDDATPPCLYEGAANTGEQMDATNSCNDSHPSSNNFDSLDRQPAFFPHADVPMWPTNYVCSTYAEETALAMDQSQTVWRFGHNWCTGSNTGFGTQNCVGSISPQGDMLSYSSDFMNTRGDRVTGASTCAHKLRGMYAPSANQTVTYMDTWFPYATSDNIFQVTGCGGNTPGATCAIGALPNWSTCSTTCTSGGAVITNLGPNTCRGDVAVMDVLSAHAAP